MNKKGQVGPVAYVFFLVFFIAIWLLFLGPYLITVGEQAIATGGLTGIEAFVYANFNLWVFLGLTLATVGYFRFMGGE